MRAWIDWVADGFTRDARLWISARHTLTSQESHALEVKLEKHLYRLKTPLQRSRRFLVIDALTQADLYAYSVLTKLRAADFPRDYPERFARVWEWMAEVERAVNAGLAPKPKVLRRPGDAVWPN
jgi:glutathione S-transferase